MATNAKPRAMRPRAVPPPRPTIPQRKPIDPSNPTYKKAAGNYMRFMIAMPILLVTSWKRRAPEQANHENSHNHYIISINHKSQHCIYHCAIPF
ncbi:uncharacterized protein GGS22DRAFT_192425 [Annulohypoxylon maeteangense]|uniref:uncharacterized protein n=1 Tax=Annulohypoxylon maeteangense TaxID=1927788 RepID=UPI0020089A73|nr:uncharacterized protein GGS22DRAFT_192425 [Annulohypoxylon maeteangense]KAI0881336.1 hypothetical protein GGS22DRAFT_192425 [Annulohypoxylon maeteangense]